MSMKFAYQNEYRNKWGAFMAFVSEQRTLSLFWPGHKYQNADIRHVFTKEQFRACSSSYSFVISGKGWIRKKEHTETLHKNPLSVKIKLFTVSVNWNHKQIQIFSQIASKYIIELRHESSYNVVCATSKCSDQPAHTLRLIRAFACRLDIRWMLSYWPNNIWSI